MSWGASKSELGCDICTSHSAVHQVAGLNATWSSFFPFCPPRWAAASTLGLPRLKTGETALAGVPSSLFERHFKGLCDIKTACLSLMNVVSFWSVSQ